MRESLRVLLESLVDYAGLFPPASLTMEEAVRRYEEYRTGEHAWMLGRFVVPAGRVAEVPRHFPLSVLSTPDSMAVADTLEIKAAHAEDVARIATTLAAHEDQPLAYVEVADVAMIETIGTYGLRAKIRTGGVTRDAFPSHTHVATFIRTCALSGVPFKATAGLHHPLRCIRPLTYAPNAPTGTMHGFVNVFMAAALVHEAERVLLEEDASAFHFEDDFASWRDHAVTTAHLKEVRDGFAISFGSCSFEEPIEDLRALGWM